MKRLVISQKPLSERLGFVINSLLTRTGTVSDICTNIVIESWRFYNQWFTVDTERDEKHLWCAFYVFACIAAKWYWEY